MTVLRRSRPSGRVWLDEQFTTWKKKKCPPVRIGRYISRGAQNIHLVEFEESLDWHRSREKVGKGEVGVGARPNGVWTGPWQPIIVASRWWLEFVIE